MSPYPSKVLTGLALLPSALGASLLASHFSGRVYTLDFDESSGNLSVVADYAGCGTTPGWLELYPEDASLWCFDESWTGSGPIVQYDVADDGTLTQGLQFQTTGNTVHGLLYGGPDGKSFIASTQ